MSFDLDAYMKERLAAVDAALDRFLPPETERPETLHKAMRYSVFAGGKRLRPILVMAGAEAVGGSAEQVMPTACAMELIHTYSLVHDDLPAMDNDDFRRGVPTNHKVFGEATAILAGDALLTLAFRLVADNLRQTSTGALDVVADIADAAGHGGMVAGQVADLDWLREQLMDRPDLFEAAQRLQFVGQQMQEREEWLTRLLVGALAASISSFTVL